MKYRVAWAYTSSLCTYYRTGNLDKGDTVDLEPVVAAAFNIDSPGVLVPVVAAPVAAPVAPAPAPKAETEPDPTDAGERMAKPATNRAYAGKGANR